MRGSAARILSSHGFHSTNLVNTTHEIPSYLTGIEDAEDPNFFEMVEFFFHRGWQVKCHTVASRSFYVLDRLLKINWWRR